VKIDQIKRLNNLASNEVWPNQKLLVQKSATQPAASSTPMFTPTPSPSRTAHSSSPTPSPSPAAAASSMSIEGPGAESGEIPTLAIFLGLIVLIPAALLVMLISERRRGTES
jgi:hypothetical protein